MWMTQAQEHCQTTGKAESKITVFLETQKDTNLPLFYKNPVGFIFYDKGIDDFFEHKDYSLISFSKSLSKTTLFGNSDIIRNKSVSPIIKNEANPVNLKTETIGTISQKKNYNPLKKYFLKRREMRKLKETGKRMRNADHKKKLYKVVRKKDPL